MKCFLIFIFSLSMTTACKHPGENSATKDDELLEPSTGKTRVIQEPDNPAIKFTSSGIPAVEYVWAPAFVLKPINDPNRPVYDVLLLNPDDSVCFFDPVHGAFVGKLEKDSNDLNLISVSGREQMRFVLQYEPPRTQYQFPRVILWPYNSPAVGPVGGLSNEGMAFIYMPQFMDPAQLAQTCAKPNR